MKNILLATTALVMTAGFASAEVTFSGTAEGGVTRTAKAAAVAAVAGRKSATGTAVTSSSANTLTNDVVRYVGGVLTIEKAGGTLATITADSTGSNAHGAASIAGMQLDVRLKAEALRLAIVQQAADQSDLDELVATKTFTEIGAEIEDLNEAKDAVAVAAAALALSQAALANATGTAAVAEGKAGDITAYSGYDFNIGLSATSDNGITFAAGFDMGAGSLSDIANNELDAQGTTIGAPTVSATMNGFTVAFKQDGIDDLYDNDQNGDVSIAGTVGTVTFKIVHDLEEDVAAVAASTKYTAGSTTTGAITTADYTTASLVTTAAKAAVYNTTSYTLGTTVGGVGLALTGTDKNDVGLSTMKAKATYSMDALTFGLETNNRGDSTKMLNATKVSLAYAGEGVSASVSSNDDKDWDASATLSAGANSATFSTDEESAWDVQVASDLGGGASVFGYVDHTELLMAGVRFKF